MRTQQLAHDVGSGIVGVLVERGTWLFPILSNPTLKSPHPPHRRVPHCPTAGTKSRHSTPLSGLSEWRFVRGLGEDMQPPLVFILVDLAAGEPLRQDLLRRGLSD